MNQEIRAFQFDLLNLSKTPATISVDWREDWVITPCEEFVLVVSGDESTTITGLAGEAGTSIGFELEVGV